ncbi:hypothetical protein, partial [Streptomyces sp. KhCrAH-43]|uniref:hypothetical protein n=1 Tax=Streptomyces sp. KhCrAH-43 TaxID=1305827 RepID=UPI00056AC9B7
RRARRSWTPVRKCGPAGGRGREKRLATRGMLLLRGGAAYPTSTTDHERMDIDQCAVNAP